MSRAEYTSISFVGLLALAATETLIGPSFPLILNEFALSHVLLGLLASAWSAGYLLSLIGGYLSDRYGEFTIITSSLLIVGVVAVLISVARSYDQLLILFLLGGTGAAFGESGMNPLMSKFFPDRRGFALNALHLFYSLGSFIGPVLAGLVISWYGRWRLAYSIMAIFFVPLIVISILTTLKMRSPSMKTRKEESSNEVVMLDIIRRGRALLLAGFFYLGAEMGTNAWLPTFLVLVRGFSIELAGLSLGLFWGAMAAGRLILGSVTDRLHFKRMMLLSSILSTILIFADLLVADQFWIILSWSLTGFTMGPVMPTIFALTSRLFTKRSGFVIGVISGLGYVGGFVTPWLLGLLVDLLSLRQAMLYLAFSASAIGISLLVADD